MEMKVGERQTLESLRQAVVPPFIMIAPFIELPEVVELVQQDKLDEDGVHGCVFTLRATAQGEGVMRGAFRDLRSGEIVKERNIEVRVV